MSSIAIRFENVSFSYDKKLVLNDLSLEVKEKNIFFLMGNNGSGKTTLLKNIMGFLLPKSGKIFINNKDVSELDYKTLSKMISYVPQAIRLNTDFKVIDYLSLGRTPHSGVLNRLKDSDYDLIDHYANLFELENIYDCEFNKLSGGQKQLVAIVRSLIQDTSIIVLDEPMSALDIGKQAELLKAMRLFANNGKTIIMTTHNPNHALSIESEVCFLKDGKIEAIGRSEDVIDENLILTIYGPNIVLDHGLYKSVVFDTIADNKI